MLDIRGRRTVLAELRDARRRFEKAAPPHVMVRDLLYELADSGPFELRCAVGAVARQDESAVPHRALISAS